MAWQQVASSLIDAHDYDPDRRRLSVRFKKGDVFHYDNVPPDEYEALAGATSAGKHFLSNIKGNYPHTRG